MARPAIAGDARRLQEQRADERRTDDLAIDAALPGPKAAGCDDAHVAREQFGSVFFATAQAPLQKDATEVA